LKNKLIEIGFKIIKDQTKQKLISNTENLKKCEKIKLEDSNTSQINDERRTKSFLPERKISQFQAKKTIYLEALNKFYY
jgi:hypothetical protein